MVIHSLYVTTPTADPQQVKFFTLDANLGTGTDPGDTV